MAQKTYCVNTKCAKPIEYAYAKPNFCPHCGNSLTAVIARPTAAAPYTPPAVKAAAPAQPIYSQSMLAVQKKMEARRSRVAEEDDIEDEDDDDHEESSAFIDFNNFQFNAVVRVPQEQKMTLGDFVKKAE